MPKPLAGGHELLLTHQEIFGSGEDHRALRRVQPIVVQRQGQKDKEFGEEPKSFTHKPEERVENDKSFGVRRTSGIHQLPKCPKTNTRDLIRSRKVPRTTRKGKIQIQLAQTLTSRVQDPQYVAFSSEQCFQYGHVSQPRRQGHYQPY
ncbi:hypothetical protein O181_052159 [Austropuccinia psidii MF-1]|uniref:Uncharacterized protein n=1 Tax=Austropuccinia psidii MF-1 TaxID=1389203 RepID=A0A9Q3E059_9BASI|nr:hypothetical protein [Austropuccinia psidii MF-1]